MLKRLIETPTSHLRFGFARTDITPPVGIYHRMWGAARHDRATGIHRPIYADILVFEPIEGDSKSRVVRVHLDLVGLGIPYHDDMVKTVREAAGVSGGNVDVGYSHTHSSGFFIANRVPFPGGELIEPYLGETNEKLRETCDRAVTDLKETLVTYGLAQCDMTANRDCFDEEFDGYVTGYNHRAVADHTISLARFTEPSGKQVATMVNYSCHATTLAWENSLISPDYIGAMREVVEGVTGAPCTFSPAPQGDQGPKVGFVGDTGIADRNGRQLGYSTLSGLESLAPPGMDFEYHGPVVSGATLGSWAYVPQVEERRRRAKDFVGGSFIVDFPMIEGLSVAGKEEEMAEWTEKQREADEKGDVLAARDAGARAERARRWIARLGGLPEGPTYPMECKVRRLGDAVWITTGAEPYCTLQMELRRRFPETAFVISPLDGNLQVAYMLDKESYGKGLYQEEPSSLAAGCLEMLIEAVSERVAEILGE